MDASVKEIEASRYMKRIFKVGFLSCGHNGLVNEKNSGVVKVRATVTSLVPYCVSNEATTPY